ncbi:MAG: SpoIIE family protein phosphatase [Nitrospira sp.]|nr:SpoIIE family protein phosphatase [Nitrospira sp.]
MKPSCPQTDAIGRSGTVEAMGARESPTVLIVDDDPVARLAMAGRIKKLGYRVLEAGDGLSGLVLLRRERPELTILDWMMPDLDGPSFCEEVRKDSSIGSSQILMMTSNDHPEHIAEGLARGADDFLSKAASRQEIIARVQAGIRAALLIRQLEQVTEELRNKQALLDQELQAAARYVESLLPIPGTVLPGVELAHLYRPSLALGGDLYNVVRCGDDSVGLYLLDASGHGVSSALRSAALATFLREDSLLRYVGSRDPGAIVTEANRLFPLTERGDYFTILIARLDLRFQRLLYAAAGHSGACIHRRSGAVEWFTPPSLPLGFDPSHLYRTVEIPFQPGDRLYVLSDGLYEVPNSTGELWGKERLATAFQKTADRTLKDVVSFVVDEAARWSGQDCFPDDVAVVGIELKA